MIRSMAMWLGRGDSGGRYNREGGDSSVAKIVLSMGEPVERGREKEGRVYGS
jgi:hypothetical protein